MTSLVCDPAQPDRIWIGSAGGGVWYSPDAGRSWTPQWHDEDVLNVGALAIDARQPDVLYCGTGEANLSADSYGGVGLYRTTDGGASWHLHASCERAGLPRRIGAIAVDPFDSQHLAVGGVGFNEVAQQRDLGGLYTSTDGGITWTRATFVAAGNHWCHAVVFHPSRRGTIYADVHGPWRRQRHLHDGRRRRDVASPHGRPSIARPHGPHESAISASNPEVLYALAADELSGRADMLLGVFRTANGGARWTSIGGTHFRNEGQISYGNTIAVHPARSVT